MCGRLILSWQLERLLKPVRLVTVTVVLVKGKNTTLVSLAMHLAKYHFDTNRNLKLPFHLRSHPITRALIGVRLVDMMQSVKETYQGLETSTHHC